MSLSRTPSPHHIIFRNQVSLGSSWQGEFLRLSLLPMTLAILRSPYRVYCRTSLCWICLVFFSWLGLGSGFWRGRSQRQRAKFITSYQEYLLSRWWMIGVDLDHLANTVVCQISPWPRFLLPLSFSEGSHCAQLTFKEWAVELHLLEDGAST